jgi:hypothetical protein
MEKDALIRAESREHGAEGKGAKSREQRAESMGHRMLVIGVLDTGCWMLDTGYKQQDKSDKR